MNPPSKRVLLLVTGGVAAYKACEVVRELHRGGFEVRVGMSPAAQAFVRPLSFEALSGHAVHTEILPGVDGGEIEHISLGRWAQLVLVVPATADFLARLVAGRANDLPSAVLLALPKSTPVLLAPAMNREMWSHPATRRNLAEIATWEGVDYSVIEPVDKELACGEVGPGGLADPVDIVRAAERRLLE